MKSLRQGEQFPVSFKQHCPFFFTHMAGNRLTGFCPSFFSFISRLYFFYNSFDLQKIEQIVQWISKYPLTPWVSPINILHY